MIGVENYPVVHIQGWDKAHHFVKQIITHIQKVTLENHQWQTLFVCKWSGYILFLFTFYTRPNLFGITFVKRGMKCDQKDK